MPNLSNLKIPIFQGINDVPRAPSAELGGNGSHMVKAFNDLIDELNVPTQIWDDYTTFWIDTELGSDSNTGLTTQSPVRTLAKLISIIKTKLLPLSITIFVKGTLSGTIDLSELWGFHKDIYINGIPEVGFYAHPLAGTWTYEGGGELLKINPSSPIKVKFTDGIFNATDKPIYVQGNNGFIDFSTGTYASSRGNNYDSVFHFSDCKLVRFSAWDDSITVINTDGNSSEGIVANNRTQLWISAVQFYNFPVGVSAYMDSSVVNLFGRCSFYNVTLNWQISENASLTTAYGDTAIAPLVDVYYGGRINGMKTYRWFFPTLSEGTLNYLIRPRTRERIQYARVDGNLTGATFSFKRNGNNTGGDLTSTNQSHHFDNSWNVNISGIANDNFSLVVTGSPTNVSLVVETMEY